MKKWWKKYKETAVAVFVLLVILTMLPYIGYQLGDNSLSELDVRNLVESFVLVEEPTIIEVPKIVEVEKIVFVDKVVEVENVVYEIVEIDKVVYVDKPVYVEKVVYVDRVQVVREIVTQIVEVPAPDAPPWKHGHNK